MICDFPITGCHIAKFPAPIFMIKTSKWHRFGRALICFLSSRKQNQ